MKKIILSLVLVLVSFNAAADVKADSFDDTGLINTTSDAAALGSCAKIADWTANAATFVRVNFIVSRPTTVAEITKKDNAVAFLTSLMTVKATNFYLAIQQLPLPDRKIAGTQLVDTQNRINEVRSANGHGSILDAYHTCTEMFSIY